MKIKNGRALKWLKAFHILTSSIWFGGVFCIAILAWIAFFQMDKDSFLIIAPLVPALYQKVILPVALITILQGIIYGFFTNWGFLKNGWIAIKWASVLLIGLCTGIGSIGQMFSVIERVQNHSFAGGFADGGMVLLFISLQLILLAVMICLSVLKPKKSKLKTAIKIIT